MKDYKLKTFMELYEERRGMKMKTPWNDFLEACAKVTQKSVSTVRNWALGHQRPDALSKEVLRQYFGRSDARSLFPEEGEGEE